LFTVFKINEVPFKSEGSPLFGMSWSFDENHLGHEGNRSLWVNPEKGKHTVSEPITIAKYLYAERNSPK
jgi:hypothetical protein